MIEERTVASVSYRYQRFIAEVLHCDTCRATFITQSNGYGTLLTESDDSELCPGCVEICGNVHIIERNRGLPS